MSRSTTAPNYADTGFLVQHLLDECKAMAKYALDAGMEVSAQLLQELQNLDYKLAESETPNDEPSPVPEEYLYCRQLGKIHNSLSKTVAPAKPGALLLLAKEAASGGFKRYLGPVPLIRQMMVVAILSLAGLILVSLSPQVDGTLNSFSLLKSSGIKLLLNELFLLTAAAVGASFFALFQANHFIKNGTYDQRYEASYWIRFVLGLMAGTIMATLIPIEAAEQQLESFYGLEKPLLSMLGGFSASVVYRILNRLVSAVESLVRGDIRTQIASREQEWKVQLQEQSLEQRVHLASKIQQLQQKFQQSDNSQLLLGELTRLQHELFINDSFLAEQPVCAGEEPAKTG